MARVNTNPEDLIRVAQAIAGTANEIQSAMTKVKSRVGSANWDDDVRKRFEEAWGGLSKSISRFSQEMETLAKEVKAKGEALREYQGKK